PVMTKLVQDPDTMLTLTDDEENNLARFIAAFRFRTHEFRAQNDVLIQGFVSFGKELTHNYIFNTMSAEQAQAAWDDVKDEPDDYWLANANPGPPSASVAHAFSEI